MESARAVKVRASLGLSASLHEAIAAVLGQPNEGLSDADAEEAQS